MRLLRGIVERILEEHADLQRLLVRCEAGEDFWPATSSAAGAARQGGDGEDCPSAGPTPTPADRRRATCYPRLTGPARPGDAVWLNATACDLALGTGGWDVVTCVEPADGRAPLSERVQGPGHVMKLRYAPCQVNVLAVEEPASPWHDTLRSADDCAGLPVACCELHSQAMAVAAAAHASDPTLRVAYVMTDEASLLLSLSDVCRAARACGVLAATFTCGQAAGGDHEAVTLHAALLAVAAMGLDAAVVSQGPGIVGTGTRFGHGGVAQGEAVNACAAVGALPLAAPRVSLADLRERHHGLSHHAAVALGRVALAPAVVPVPSPLLAAPVAWDAGGLGEPAPVTPAEAASLLDRQLDESGAWRRHERTDVPVPCDPARFAALSCGLRVTSMGRGPEADPAFFRVAFACGIELAHRAGARRGR